MIESSNPNEREHPVPPSWWDYYLLLTNHVWHEDGLIQSQTTTFATLVSILFSGLVVMVSLGPGIGRSQVADDLAVALCVAGFLLSFLWLLSINRTVDALRVWREMARTLEGAFSPQDSDSRLAAVDGFSVFQPYAAHAGVFLPKSSLSRTDLNAVEEALLGKRFTVRWLSSHSTLRIWRWIPAVFMTLWLLSLAILALGIVGHLPAIV